MPQADRFEDLMIILAEVDKKNANGKEEFFDSIKGLPVRWWDKDQKRGQIVKNGIILEFDVTETMISTQIKLEHLPSTIENFRKLSENNYK